MSCCCCCWTMAIATTHIAAYSLNTLAENISNERGKTLSKGFLRERESVSGSFWSVPWSCGSPDRLCNTPLRAMMGGTLHGHHFLFDSLSLMHSVPRLPIYYKRERTFNCTQAVKGGTTCCPCDVTWQRDCGSWNNLVNTPKKPK
jgi:hypothetical protein